MFMSWVLISLELQPWRVIIEKALHYNNKNPAERIWVFVRMRILNPCPFPFKTILIFVLNFAASIPASAKVLPASTDAVAPPSTSAPPPSTGTSGE